MSGDTKASLLGERAQVAVERALSEFRSGRPVLITSGSDAMMALPVDGMTEAVNHRWRWSLLRRWRSVSESLLLPSASLPRQRYLSAASRLVL